jgi:hypothetical protein
MKVILKTPETIADAGQWFVAEDTATDPVSLEQEAHTGADGKPMFYGLLHQHGGSQQRVNDGDWIVKHPDVLDDKGNVLEHGKLEALSPADFEKTWAPYDMAERVNTPPKKLPAKHKGDE